MKRTIDKKLRWMGLPKYLSSTTLYETQQLSFSNMKVEFAVNQTSDRDSREIKVKAARIQTRAGRRWSTPRELQVAEEKLRQKALKTLTLWITQINGGLSPELKHIYFSFTIHKYKKLKITKQKSTWQNSVISSDILKLTASIIYKCNVNIIVRNFGYIIH